PPRPTLFPYTTLFRSGRPVGDPMRSYTQHRASHRANAATSPSRLFHASVTTLAAPIFFYCCDQILLCEIGPQFRRDVYFRVRERSEEHTSELQSRENL